jgi:hypothetical protein
MNALSEKVEKTKSCSKCSGDGCWHCTGTGIEPKFDPDSKDEKVGNDGAGGPGYVYSILQCKTEEEAQSVLDAIVSHTQSKSYDEGWQDGWVAHLEKPDFAKGFEKGFNTAKWNDPSYKNQGNGFKKQDLGGKDIIADTFDRASKRLKKLVGGK